MATLAPPPSKPGSTRRLYKHPETGDVYDGEWETIDGTPHMHGRGSLRFANGDRYIGKWQKSKRHGQGKFIERNGTTYDGHWREDTAHGLGTLTLANGDVYTGEWRGGRKHGKGRYAFKDGHVFEGEWEAGKHVEGKFRLATGEVFIGKRKDGSS